MTGPSAEPSAEQSGFDQTAAKTAHEDLQIITIKDKAWYVCDIRRCGSRRVAGPHGVASGAWTIAGRRDCTS
jgi:hypothetical protein